MVCLGFEPRLQDGRRRQNHGAMAATQKKENMLLFVCCEAVESMLVKLETSCPVILPPMASVLW